MVSRTHFFLLHFARRTFVLFLLAQFALLRLLFTYPSEPSLVECQRSMMSTMRPNALIIRDGASASPSGAAAVASSILDAVEDTLSRTNTTTTAAGAGATTTTMREEGQHDKEEERAVPRFQTTDVIRTGLSSSTTSTTFKLKDVGGRCEKQPTTTTTLPAVVHKNYPNTQTNETASAEDESSQPRPVAVDDHDDDDGDSSNSSSNKMVEEKIYEPEPLDIVFGRGKPFQGHPGNQLLRRVVEKYKEEYAASRRYDKLAIAEEIVHGLQTGRFSSTNPKTKSRFLKRPETAEDDDDDDDKKKAYWIIAPREEAREKVCGIAVIKL